MSEDPDIEDLTEQEDTKVQGGVQNAVDKTIIIQDEEENVAASGNAVPPQQSVWDVPTDVPNSESVKDETQVKPATHQGGGVSSSSSSSSVPPKPRTWGTPGIRTYKGSTRPPHVWPSEAWTWYTPKLKQEAIK